MNDRAQTVSLRDQIWFRFRVNQKVQIRFRLWAQTEHQLDRLRGPLLDQLRYQLRERLALPALELSTREAAAMLQAGERVQLVGSWHLEVWLGPDGAVYSNDRDEPLFHSVADFIAEDALGSPLQWRREV